MSAVHGKKVSINHPSIVLAPEVNAEDDQESQRTLRQLMLLGSDLKQAMLLSHDKPPPNDEAEIRKRLTETETGTPIVWIYASLEAGVHCSYPGHAGYPPDYDPRVRPFYRKAEFPDHGLTWGVYEDVQGRGFLLFCSAPIYDDNDNFLGVVGFDLLIDSKIVNLLKIDLPYVENSFLVDADGHALVDANGNVLVDADGNAEEPNNGGIPDEVARQIKKGESGLIKTVDGRCVVFLPLDVMGWYYVVVADVDHLKREALRIAGKTNSRFVATVARRWAGESPRSGDRSYGKTPKLFSPRS
jgi:hypothetical protein